MEFDGRQTGGHWNYVYVFSEMVYKTDKVLKNWSYQVSYSRQTWQSFFSEKKLWKIFFENSPLNQNSNTIYSLFPDAHWIRGFAVPQGDNIWETRNKKIRSYPSGNKNECVPWDFIIFNKYLKILQAAFTIGIIELILNKENDKKSLIKRCKKEQ